mgnify:FL=1
MAEVVWRLSPSWTVDRASKVPGSVKLPAVELIEIYMCLTTHQGAKNTTAGSFHPFSGQLPSQPCLYLWKLPWKILSKWLIIMGKKFPRCAWLELRVACIYGEYGTTH